MFLFYKINIHAQPASPLSAFFLLFNKFWGTVMPVRLYLINPTSAPAEQGLGELATRQNLWRATEDKKLCRSMSTHVLKGHGTKKMKKKKVRID